MRDTRVGLRVSSMGSSVSTPGISALHRLWANMGRPISSQGELPRLTSPRQTPFGTAFLAP